MPIAFYFYFTASKKWMIIGCVCVQPVFLSLIGGFVWSIGSCLSIRNYVYISGEFANKYMNKNNWKKKQPLTAIRREKLTLRARANDWIKVGHPLTTTEFLLHPISIFHLSVIKIQMSTHALQTHISHIYLPSAPRSTEVGVRAR